MNTKSDPIQNTNALIRLEEEIINLRVQNRHASLQLKNLQEDIDNFMANYFEAVGDLCIELSDMDEKIKSYDARLAGEVYVQQPVTDILDEVEDDFQNPGFNEIRPRETDLEKEVKNLYRKLIKTIHPDISEDKLQAAEYTRLVNEAYNKRNYRQLVELEQLITSGKATERDLTRQRNQLIDATFELKQQREALLDNPIYDLKEQFESADDGGKSMILDIRISLEKRLAAKKRDLRAKKLEYLESISRKISAQQTGDAVKLEA